MKTLVLFEKHDGLLSCYLSDLPLPPVEGRHYVFDGKRYQVTEIIECLGVKGEDGRVRSANEKLLELLSALSGDGTSALALLARVTDIGPGDTARPSGLVVVGSVLPTDFDHVVFVRLKSLSKKLGVKTTLRLAQFVNLVAPAAPACCTKGGGETGGDEDIVLGER